MTFLAKKPVPPSPATEELVKIVSTAAKGNGIYEVSFTIDGRKGKAVAQTAPKKFAYPD